MKSASARVAEEGYILQNLYFVSTDHIALIKNDTRTINGWAMYDWANSVYALVIASAIFPAYYNEVTRGHGNELVRLFGLELQNTAIYSICLGLSFGLVAFITPLLSSIADYTGLHKLFMKIFCYTGGLACAALFWFDGTNVTLGLICLMLATIGYAGSMVYYNAYLPVIVSDDRKDFVSARGYALGYIGASTLLLINLALILNQRRLGIEDDTLLPRLSFLLTGIWWIGFAQISFRRLPRGTHDRQNVSFNPWRGYQELRKVWQSLKKTPILRRFLCGFFWYILGVQTVMFMAASFGEKEVHLTLTQLITVVLILEYIGIAGAYLFAWMSRKIGNLPALLVAISCWILICVGAYFISSAFHFYIAAFFIGIVMGGVQALSRSTFAKLIPVTQNNAGYFGFYDVCEKVAMMMGLVMFGYLDNLTGSMRNSIIALTICFILGAVVLAYAHQGLKRSST